MTFKDIEMLTGYWYILWRFGHEYRVSTYVSTCTRDQTCHVQIDASWLPTLNHAGKCLIIQGQSNTFRHIR